MVRKEIKRTQQKWESQESQLFVSGLLLHYGGSGSGDVGGGGGGGDGGGVGHNGLTTAIYLIFNLG